MQGAKKLRVAVLYPDQLNIYADRGNLLFLRRRCEWRGIEFAPIPIGFGQELEADQFDLIYIGGGQDREQALCAADLAGTKASVLASWYQSGRPLLAVCGGYQLLGTHYTTASDRVEGAGAASLFTESANPRLIGPVAIQTDLGGPTNGVLAGFENHAGRTTLGADESPLGKVIKGFGNDGQSGFEGVRNGCAIGTYLHGPLLPKNWWLADWLIAHGIGVDPSELSELEDEFERSAHQSAARAAGLSG